MFYTRIFKPCENVDKMYAREKFYVNNPKVILSSMAFHTVEYSMQNLNIATRKNREIYCIVFLKRKILLTSAIDIKRYRTRAMTWDMARVTAHVRSFWKFFHFVNQFPQLAHKWSTSQARVFITLEVRKYTSYCWSRGSRVLSGSPAKSGPMTLTSENRFPLFLCVERHWYTSVQNKFIFWKFFFMASLDAETHLPVQSYFQAKSKVEFRQIVESRWVKTPDYFQISTRSTS
jgi:hypothetical protein